MHRISTKRLTAFIVSLVACLALVGSSALYSAQSLTKASAKAAKQGSASATKMSGAAKAPAAKAPAAQKASSARKRTNGAANTVVSGTTTDGSGHGWPLYSRLDFTSDSTEPLVVYSDPVTGQYEATLFSGIEYTVTVTSVLAGYVPATGTVTTEGTPIVSDWPLEAAASCTAPGYAYPAGTLFETFSTGALPEGWSTETPNGGGDWRFPATASGDSGCANSGGNNTGGEGGFALLDSDCDGLIQDDAYLNTPSLDLSAVASPVLLFNSDYVDLDSIADVDVSNDGGTTWNTVWERAGADDIGPTQQQVDLSKDAGNQADVRARFHYTGFWAWWWKVDNVVLGDTTCLPSISGGLVVGNVTSGATGEGLNGATVTNLGNATWTKTFATPDDPAQGDGFYILFAPAGPQTLEASQTLYQSDTHTKTVFTNDAVRQDFVLESGHVDAAPRPLSAVITTNNTDTKTLTLTNDGTVDATFEIQEGNAPLLLNVTAGFASPSVRQQALARLPKDARGKSDLAGRSGKDLAPLPNRPTNLSNRTLAAGDVLGSSPTNLTLGWGVGYAADTNSTWITDLGVAGGDDMAHEFDAAGVSTGNTIDLVGGFDAWAGDGAFNANTGNIWYVSVVGAGSSCIFEVNPVTKLLTGNSICPGTGTSERGLAYNMITDSFYTGSWLDGTIFHFDTEGTILDSAAVGLGISGLAFYPETGHLFVQVSDPVDFAISVLDTNDNYNSLGSFNVGDGAFDDHGGSGMEADCEGNLWMVNQNTEVLYKVASGEGSTCAIDVPWLSEDPVEGVVTANGGTVPIAVTFNSSGMLPGLRQAQLKVKTDTPTPVPGVPVTLTVLFNDVPEDSFAWNFIYGAAGAGVMRGCGFYTFCPNGIVTRADMAGYLWRAIQGPLTPPPVYLGGFTDVFFNDYNANYIQGIFDMGITVGCGDGTTYCPNSPNTRAQMSVFIWKGEHGDTAPPACVGVFTDVPCPSGFAVDFIEGLYNEGVTAGCGGGNFCPDANITNAQMSVFLVKGFNIPYVP